MLSRKQNVRLLGRLLEFRTWNDDAVFERRHESWHEPWRDAPDLHCHGGYDHDIDLFEIDDFPSDIFSRCRVKTSRDEDGCTRREYIFSSLEVTLEDWRRMTT